MKKHNFKWYLSRMGSHLLLIIGSAFIGIPFFWMITTALKSPAEVATFPPIWWPKVIRWDNFSKAWAMAPFGRFYVNSAITAISGVLIEVSVAAFSAYAFARIKIKGRDFLFLVLLSAMMIPSQVAIIPNYVILKHLKWINTYAGIVIPGVSSVFCTFLFRQYFLAIPSALYDAGEVEGLGHMKILFYIALPMARPVLGTALLYLFLNKWNSYLWPLIVTNTQNMRTLPVGLSMVRNAEYAIGPEHLMAASLFALIPPIIIYFIAQKQLIEGITAGAVKG